MGSLSKIQRQLKQPVKAGESKEKSKNIGQKIVGGLAEAVRGVPAFALGLGKDVGKFAIRNLIVARDEDLLRKGGVKAFAKEYPTLTGLTVGTVEGFKQTARELNPSGGFKTLRKAYAEDPVGAFLNDAANIATVASAGVAAAGKAATLAETAGRAEQAARAAKAAKTLRTVEKVSGKAAAIPFLPYKLPGKTLRLVGERSLERATQLAAEGQPVPKRLQVGLRFSPVYKRVTAKIIEGQEKEILAQERAAQRAFKQFKVTKDPDVHSAAILLRETGGTAEPFRSMEKVNPDWWQNVPGLSQKAVRLAVDYASGTLDESVRRQIDEINRIWREEGGEASAAARNERFVRENPWQASYEPYQAAIAAVAERGGRLLEAQEKRTLPLRRAATQAEKMLADVLERTETPLRIRTLVDDLRAEAAKPQPSPAKVERLTKNLWKEYRRLQGQAFAKAHLRRIPAADIQRWVQMLDDDIRALSQRKDVTLTGTLVRIREVQKLLQQMRTGPLDTLPRLLIALDDLQKALPDQSLHLNDVASELVQMVRAKGSPKLPGQLAVAYEAAKARMVSTIADAVRQELAQAGVVTGQPFRPPRTTMPRQQFERAVKEAHELWKQIYGEENARKLVQEKREALTKAEKRTEYLTQKIAEMIKAEAEKVENAPSRLRPLLATGKLAAAQLQRMIDYFHNEIVADPMSADAWLYPLALAEEALDNIPTTLEALKERGVSPEYFPHVRKQTRLGPAAQPKEVQLPRTFVAGSRRHRLGALFDYERTPEGARIAEAQLDIDFIRRETVDAISRIKGAVVPATDLLRRGAKTVKQAEEMGYVAWNPDNVFATFPKDTRIGGDMKFMPKPLFDSLRPYFERPRGQVLGLITDIPNRLYYIGRLALSPGYITGQVVGNLFMGTIGASNPAEFLRQSMRTIRHWREHGTLFPETPVRIQRAGSTTAQLRRLLEETESRPKSRVTKFIDQKLLEGVLNKPFRVAAFLDNFARSAFYLAEVEHLKRRGVSPEIATERALENTLRAMGEFDRMTGVERDYVRRVIPLWAWHREITRVAGNLLVDHPLRITWTLHLGKQASDINGALPIPQFVGSLVHVGGRWVDLGQMFPHVQVAEAFRGPFFGAMKIAGPVPKVTFQSFTGLRAGTGLPFRVKGRFGHRPVAPSILRQTLDLFPQTRLVEGLQGKRKLLRYATGEPIVFGAGQQRRRTRVFGGSLRSTTAPVGKGRRVIRTGEDPIAALTAFFGFPAFGKEKQTKFAP